MTNKQKETRPDFEKYAYAGLAGQLAQSKNDSIYVEGATDLLRKNLSYNEEGEALYKGFVINEEGEFVSDQARNKFIKVYNQMFQRKLTEAKVSELYSLYEPALSGASDEQKALIKAEFDKFGGENYGKVLEEYLSAKEITDSETKNFSEKKKEEAEKEVKKYEGFMAARGILEKYYFENLRAKAVKESKKKTFGGLEQMLKGDLNGE